MSALHCQEMIWENLFAMSNDPVSSSSNWMFFISVHKPVQKCLLTRDSEAMGHTALMVIYHEPVWRKKGGRGFNLSFIMTCLLVLYTVKKCFEDSANDAYLNLSQVFCCGWEKQRVTDCKPYGQDFGTSFQSFHLFNFFDRPWISFLVKWQG